MKLFKTAPKPEPTTYEMVYQRMGRLDAGTILDWADTAGTAMAKGFQDYRRYGSSDSLEECRKGAESLLAIVDLLSARQH